MSRQIILDTETTGIAPDQGHGIIEIGCIELIDREPTGHNFHQYIKPQRPVEEGAFAVHGISDAFLADKPPFAQVVDELMAYLRGAELIIHNAPFDVGFVDAELKRCAYDPSSITVVCSVIDTLKMARSMHPGQRNNLDALCKRYGIDNSGRELHGALLDSELLAEVYLAMTGGQGDLFGSDSPAAPATNTTQVTASAAAAEMAESAAMTGRPQLIVLQATAEEQEGHQQYLHAMKQAHEQCLWLQDETEHGSS